MDEINLNRRTYGLVERGIEQISRLADEVERLNDNLEGDD